MLHSNNRPDRELIIAAQSGDAAAFGDLIRRHQRAAIRVAAMALGAADGAEDVAQEAFVKMHRSIDRFRVNDPFEPWLYRIVTNTARNRLRHEGRQRGLHLRVAALASVPDSGPEDIASHLADRRDVVAAINQLDLDDRLILTYRWFEQLSEKEIAVAMDLRAGTVKSRLSRAMNRLRRELNA